MDSLRPAAGLAFIVAPAGAAGNGFAPTRPLYHSPGATSDNGCYVRSRPNLMNVPIVSSAIEHLLSG